MVNQIPVIDSDKCIRCEKCIIACPKNAIINSSNAACSKCIKYCLSMSVPCNPDHYIFCYEQCDSCGLCITACANDAIYWYNSMKKDK